MSRLSIHATMRRRLLVNFRVDPAAIASLLPPPFEPRLVNGWGMTGICLIALDQLRPGRIPAALGVHTENVAHRIAVEWSSPTGRQQGVYIPRRDTNSWFVRAMGGRVFPGVYHRGRFEIVEDATHLRIRMRSDDGSTDVLVDARPTDEFAKGSVFGSLQAASRFFAVGSLGFSPDAGGKCLDGLELVAERWEVRPLAVDRVTSRFFGDRELFKPGSIEFDCALIMRGIPCLWRSHDVMEIGPRLSRAG
jgi:uncharacterized protein DUF2071